MKLYEITKEYKEAIDSLTDLDDIAVIDTLGALKGELTVKQISVAAYIGNLEAEALAIKNAEANMAKRRKALENRSASVKNYLKMNMKACGIHEIKTPEFVVKIVSNPPAVKITDEDSIPDEYKTEVITTKINKVDLKKALKEKSIPGAELQQGERLKIQ